MKAKPSQDEERRLIAAAQQDPACFGELYDLHFDRVYAYIARRSASRADAEDATAEVFRRALENLPQFEWRGAPFAAWLYRIAANALADHGRRAARESDHPAGDPEAPPGPDIAAAEQRARLYALVRGLPADQRRVVEARFGEEKSIREIAQAMGRSEGAVKQLQFRALETLRAHMGKKNG